jgi:hypothetical protein
MPSASSWQVWYSQAKRSQLSHHEWNTGHHGRLGVGWPTLFRLMRMKLNTPSRKWMSMERWLALGRRTLFRRAGV